MRKGELDVQRHAPPSDQPFTGGRPRGDGVAAPLVPACSRIACGIGHSNPPAAVSGLDVCSPFLVTTADGTSPETAVVDVEVRGDTPVQFCTPGSPLNPVLIDPTTGDLGPGPVEIDGTIGGEATAAAGSVVGEGELTFGISSSGAGTFDIIVFIEDPGTDNDDPESSEPQDTASLLVGPFGGDSDGNGSEVPGATALVTSLDCLPEDDIDASGSTHDFFCRATGVGGLSVIGAEVSLDVTEGPNTEEIGSRQCGYTDANGVALCSYRDSTDAGSPAGTDTIVGFTGSDLVTSLNQDTIQVTFSGTADAEATKVASTVNIRKRFKGKVRSAVQECKGSRKVVVKKVRSGKDRVVGKDRTNGKGAYRVAKQGAKGRFYSVAKKKSYVSGGSTIICKKSRSKTVRRR